MTPATLGEALHKTTPAGSLESFSWSQLKVRKLIQVALTWGLLKILSVSRFVRCHGSSGTAYGTVTSLSRLINSGQSIVRMGMSYRP